MAVVRWDRRMVAADFLVAVEVVRATVAAVVRRVVAAVGTHLAAVVVVRVRVRPVVGHRVQGLRAAVESTRDFRRYFLQGL